VIFRFSRWQLPSWILEMAKFYWLAGSGGPRCIIVTNFVRIGQSVAEIAIFQDGGNPPSWICLGHIKTTDEESTWWSLSPDKIWIRSMQEFC